MNHPFSKMFEKALLKSYGDENFVLAEAEALLDTAGIERPGHMMGGRHGGGMGMHRGQGRN